MLTQRQTCYVRMDGDDQDSNHAVQIFSHHKALFFQENGSLLSET